MKCNSNKIFQTTSECENLVYSGQKNLSNVSLPKIIVCIFIRLSCSFILRLENQTNKIQEYTGWSSLSVINRQVYFIKNATDKKTSNRQAQFKYYGFNFCRSYSGLWFFKFTPHTFSVNYCGCIVLFYYQLCFKPCIH